MPQHVKKVFGSLQRTLELDGSPGPFTLYGDIVPVAILHEHCGAEMSSMFFSQAGAFAAGNLGNTGVLAEGSYAVSGTWGFSLAIAFPATVRMIVEHISVAVPMTHVLAVFHASSVGAIMGSFVVPRVHLEAGDSVRVRTLDNILVNDAAIGSIIVQQV